MSKRKKRSSKKKNRTTAAVLGTLAIVVLAVSITLGTQYLLDNKIINFGESAELYVYPNTTVGDIVAKLDGAVKRPGSLKRAFQEVDLEHNIKPGHYSVDASNTSMYVARMLSHGWQSPVRVTLSGTLRRKCDIASKISRQMMVDSASVHKALCDAELLAELGFTPQNVFSMIIPDTYEMYWTEDAKKILSRLADGYRAFWTGERLLKAGSLGLTPEQVSIVASIVKGETNHEPEMPKIASVYLNRYKIGMLLQADPTIAYCYDYQINRILKKHLAVQSPYNTYKNKGLPPGPICCPTRAALDAVLNPAHTKYLYFCADPSFNGTHRFAVTYKEHMANAKAFQKALNQRNNSK